MRVHVGTSGFSYKEWKGSFYPRDLGERELLAFYASRFDTVEINNTFYRMPKPSALEGWAKKVAAAPDFRFALKAPVYLGLWANGQDRAPMARQFADLARRLGPALGPIYVQLPPTAKKDLRGLSTLLGWLSPGLRVAVELPASWQDDDTYALLRERRAALVAVDDVERPSPLVPTAELGYLRLRRTKYTKAALERWAARVREQPFRDAWVYFKHEDAGTGPRLAAAFVRALAAHG